VTLRSSQILNLAIPVATLVTWETLGRLDILPHYLSARSWIAAALWEFTQSGELFTALEASLYRLIVGFLIGMVAGIGLGMGAGLISAVRHFFFLLRLSHS
jgi:NitT/TauT family transport system permease protein